MNMLEKEMISSYIKICMNDLKIETKQFKKHLNVLKNIIKLTDVYDIGLSLKKLHLFKFLVIFLESLFEEKLITKIK